MSSYLAAQALVTERIEQIKVTLAAPPPVENEPPAARDTADTSNADLVYGDADEDVNDLEDDLDVAPQTRALASSPVTGTAPRR